MLAVGPLRYDPMAAAAAEPKKKFPGFKNALQSFGQKIEQKVDQIAQKHQERRAGALGGHSPRPAEGASPRPAEASTTSAAHAGTPMFVETRLGTAAGPPPGLGGGDDQKRLEDLNAQLAYDNAVLRKRAENAHLQTENALLRKKLMEATAAAAVANANLVQPPVNPYYSDSPLPSWGSGYSMEATGWGGYSVDTPIPSFGSNGSPLPSFGSNVSTPLPSFGSNGTYADSIPENGSSDAADAGGDNATPRVDAAPTLALPVMPPQAQPLVVEVGDNGHACVRWTVDSKRLKGTDKTIVSPSFDLPACASAAFKMLIAPKAVSDTKGGASFKRSKGRGRLQVKCASEVEAGSLRPVTLHVFVGGVGGQEVAHGPLTHNFSESPVCSPQEDWDFAAAVEDGQQSFIVRLELSRAEDAAAS